MSKYFWFVFVVRNLLIAAISAAVTFVVLHYLVLG